MEKSAKYLKSFRFHSLLTLGVLMIEFVLGMYTALFVKFPDTLVNGEAWRWSMESSPIILIHILVGTMLVLLAVSALVFAIMSHSRAALIGAIAGLVLIAVAYMGGSVFLSNVNEDINSFIMALGFMGSVAAYGAAFYLTRPTEKA